jgi:hypothetical protein
MWAFLLGYRKPEYAKCIALLFLQPLITGRWFWIISWVCMEQFSISSRFKSVDSRTRALLEKDVLCTMYELDINPSIFCWQNKCVLTKSTEVSYSLNHVVSEMVNCSWYNNSQNCIWWRIILVLFESGGYSDRLCIQLFSWYQSEVL